MCVCLDTRTSVDTCGAVMTAPAYLCLGIATVTTLLL